MNLKRNEVKFIRFGGLSPAIQNGYDSSMPTYHCPPTRKGIYAFRYPYIEHFLLGGTNTLGGYDGTSNRVKYISKKDGNPVTNLDPEFAELIEKKNSFSVISKEYSDAINAHNGNFTGIKHYLVTWTEKPKIFETENDVWHHLGEHLKQKNIMKRKGFWVLTTMENYLKAFKKESHKTKSENILDMGQRYKFGNTPFKYCSKKTILKYFSKGFNLTNVIIPATYPHMTPHTFDKWDYQLILSFKRYAMENDDLNLSKKVWSERCAIDLKNYDPTPHIVERMTLMVSHLYNKTGSIVYSPITILEENSPRNDWKYEQEIGNRDTSGTYYWNRIFHVYANILTHIECSLVEGLDEYFENEWKKSGKP